ncbi:expressed protein [Phakopsora pachyrhizi]|uniref:Expressed protein n=1 Tax=Phakopsora pachyrhizi TaxID=170000 RepID=A0AAV0BGE8_PHAPC|nr:expressed protein [Phakopsora pachyrhizi]
MEFSPSLILPLYPPLESRPSEEEIARLPVRMNHKLCCHTETSSKILDDWKISTHLYPAAYPRSVEGSTTGYGEMSFPVDQLKDKNPNVIAEKLTEANRKAKRFKSYDEMMEIKQPQLFISVSRYYRKKALPLSKKPRCGHALTPVLVHGILLHKEVWETTLGRLLNSPAADSIEEVWSLDLVQHGDSALLNKDKLGQISDWNDSARDILQFILSYLPESSQSADELPMVLPRLEVSDPNLLQLDYAVPKKLSNADSIKGLWRSRKVSLWGHSYGTALATLSITSLPQIFHSATLIEPVVMPFSKERLPREEALTIFVASKMPEWKSRESAAKILSKCGKNNPFCTWHPLGIQNFVNFGMVTNSFDEKGVEEKYNRIFVASPTTDASVRSISCYERLVKMRNPPMCEKSQYMPQLHIILADSRASLILDKNLKEYIIKLKPDSQTNRLKDVSHSVIASHPLELGEEIVKKITELSDQTISARL